MSYAYIKLSFILVYLPTPIVEHIGHITYARKWENGAVYLVYLWNR